MDAVLHSNKNNSSVVISFNKRTLDDSDFYEGQYKFECIPVFQEYILSQVYRAGRFYNGYVCMSDRSVNKFKKWAEENDINSPYDFWYEF